MDVKVAKRLAALGDERALEELDRLKLRSHAVEPLVVEGAKTIESLVGQTFAHVHVCSVDPRWGDEELVLVRNDGSSVHFCHPQECCEHVRIESINGELPDLVGVPIVSAFESTREATSEETHDSGTWTFYHFRTIRGDVCIRWLGESNGYYSENVDVRSLDPEATARLLRDLKIKEDRE